MEEGELEEVEKWLWRLSVCIRCNWLIASCTSQHPNTHWPAPTHAHQRPIVFCSLCGCDAYTSLLHKCTNIAHVSPSTSTTRNTFCWSVTGPFERILLSIGQLLVLLNGHRFTSAQSHNQKPIMWQITSHVTNNRSLEYKLDTSREQSRDHKSFTWSKINHVTNNRSHDHKLSIMWPW